MKTKLTLRLERALIEKAKVYAEERGTSVSQMVADYFSLLKTESGTSEESAEGLLPEGYEPTSFTKSLIGVFGEGKDDIDYKEEYYRYLEEKHR